MYGLYQVRGVSGPLFVIYCIIGHFCAQNTCFPVLLGWHYNTNKQSYYQTVLTTCRNRFMYGLYQVRGVSGPLFVIYGILINGILGHFWD